MKSAEKRASSAMRPKEDKHDLKKNEASPKGGKSLFERIFATYKDVTEKEAKKKQDLYGFKFHIQDFLFYNSKYPNYLGIHESENIAILDPSNDFWFKTKAIYMTSTGETHGILEFKNQTIEFN